MNKTDSFFIAYLKELEDQDAIVNDYGFITYRFFGPECYVFNLYITPSARGTKRAKTLFNSLQEKCREQEIRVISCNVFKKDSGNARNISIYQSQGFNILQENEKAYTLVKELNYGIHK